MGSYEPRIINFNFIPEFLFRLFTGLTDFNLVVWLNKTDFQSLSEHIFNFKRSDFIFNGLKISNMTVLRK